MTTSRLIIASHAGPIGSNDQTFAVGIASRVLTNDEIKQPGKYELVAAPGVGKLLIVLAAVAVVRKAAVYSNVDTIANTYLVYGSAGGSATTAGNPDGDHYIFDDYATTPVLYAQTPDFGIQEDVLSNYENLPLNVYVSNGSSGAMTGGDPSNTLTMTATYIVVDV